MTCFWSDCFDESFQFGRVVGFLAKVDNVDGNVVLFHFLGKTDEVWGCVFNRGGDKDYDTLFL